MPRPRDTLETGRRVRVVSKGTRPHGWPNTTVTCVWVTPGEVYAMMDVYEPGGHMGQLVTRREHLNTWLILMLGAYEVANVEEK